MSTPLVALGPKLTDIKGLSPASGESIWWNGTHYASRTIQVADVPTLTSAKISDFATAADARVAAAIGSSVEAWDADLDAIAALTPSNGAFIRRTGGVWVGATLVVADIPTLTLSKISDAGTIASQNANAAAITGGTINGTTVGATTPGTVNATTAYVGTTGGPVATELTVVTTSAADPRGIMSAQYSTDALASRLHMRKARGTPASPTVIVAGDILGRFRFSGYDGANFLQMASIDAVSTGTIASTRVPTYLSFSVATDAAPSVLTEVGRFTITGLNNAAIGATAARAITGTIVNITNQMVVVSATTQVIDISGQTTNGQWWYWHNTGASFYLGVEGNGGGIVFNGSSSYAGVIGTSNATSVQIATNNTVRTTINSIGVLTQIATDAVTAAVTNVAILRHGLTTANAGANGIATGLSFEAADASSAIGAGVTVAALNASLPVATHLSRTGQLDIVVSDAGGARTVASFGANGTNPTMGVLGAAASARISVTGSRGGNAALASFLTAMATFGFITDNTTA